MKRIFFSLLIVLNSGAVNAQFATRKVSKNEQAYGSSIVKYGMDKQVLENWNGIIGAKFQLNKRWMLRTEWGLIGDRKTALASLNYRFLL